MARVPWRQRYRDSKTIFRASLAALGSERDLWRFPIAAGLVLALAMVGIVLAGSFMAQLHPAVWIVVVLAAMLPVSILSAMLQTAMAHCLLERWQGRPATSRDGWRAARSQSGLIVRFSIVASLVAGVFAIIGQALDKFRLVPGLGRILNLVGIFGWATASFFVIPAIAAGRTTSVTGALKESVGLAREQWGKSVACMVTIGLVLVVPMLVVMVPIIFLAPLLILTGMPMWAFVAVTFAPLALFMLVGVPLQNAATTTYQAALYRFATTGQAPAGFSDRTLVDPWRAYQ